MDKGTYTMGALYDKYDRFSAPSFRVTVDGKKFDSAVHHISRLEVEQRADGTAGGCTFVMEGHYDYETGKWMNALTDVIHAGATLSISGGYMPMKELFFGYVDEYQIVFPTTAEQKAPVITVTGIDGLGFLMNQYKPIYGGKKKAAEVVKETMYKAVTAGFARKVAIGTLQDYETPIVKENGNDWNFLNQLAARYGVTMFVLCGEMIFDSVAAQTTPILTLNVGRGLRSFEKRVSIARQVGKVEIHGRDVNQKSIIGSASTVSVGDKGKKSAVKVVPALSKAVLREFSEFVRTQKECVRFAQARLDDIAMGFVSGKGSSVGIPELIPGRYLNVEGGDDQTNGKYFLSLVRHIFQDNGYVTEFEVKGARI